MLTYNTQQGHLVLPEYGRHVQEMVAHCLTIEDREERNLCAQTIVKTMSILFPDRASSEEGKQKLWDHLAIMSNFKLDIDWPYPPLTAEAAQGEINPVPYTNHDIKLRHYGIALEKAIAKASEMEAGPEKDELVLLLTAQMKKLLTSLNKDNAGDERVFRDLADYTHGAMVIDPEDVHLPEFPANEGSKAPKLIKKKKRKK